MLSKLHKMKSNLLLTILFLFFASSLFSQPIDKKATKETVALFKNLKELSKNHTLFAHQHATEYGHGWSGDENRSDVKSVCGSHPAMIGVDFSGFSGRPKEAVDREKEKLRKNVVDTYNRGGVTTAAWHFNNPVSGGGFYWKDSVSLPAVKYIIPGGEAHEKYKDILDEIGDWAKSLKGADGTLAPVIFRPFHEFDGGWFWWGAPHCTKEEFVSLWKFTVSYLRDSLEVHNFLYAFSPIINSIPKNNSLNATPATSGLTWLAWTITATWAATVTLGNIASKKLKIVSDYAIKKGKLAAFTETGLESIPDTTWWTETLLKVMKKDNMQLCYVLVWRNDTRSPTHYYAPFPGQVSVPNFMEFYNDPYTLFEKDLKGIYK
jgi:mannan endo-1,4-beta-mannosidase